MEIERELAGRQGERPVEGQRERRLPQLHRVQAEQQVVHDGIADQGDFQDLLRRGAALRRRLVEQVPHRGADRGGHLPFPPGVHHHVRDPAHEVLAEPDLRVHRAGRRDHFARDEVAHVGRNRGRADVDRRPVHPVAQARPHREDVAVAVNRDGDAPFAGPQRRLQGPEHVEAAAQVLDTPLPGERRLQAAQVSGRLVHVGRGHLDVAEPHHRVDADRMHLGPLAHHLSVDLAVRGDVDDGVAPEPGRAAEPASGGQRRPLLVVAPFDRPELGQVLGPGTHSVLGELPDPLDHLATAADPPPAAYRVEVHAQRPRGVEDRSAAGKPPPAAPTG